MGFLSKLFFSDEDKCLLLLEVLNEAAKNPDIRLVNKGYMVKITQRIKSVYYDDADFQRMFATSGGGDDWNEIGSQQ